MNIALRIALKVISINRKQLSEAILENLRFVKNVNTFIPTIGSLMASFLT